MDNIFFSSVTLARMLKLLKKSAFFILIFLIPLLMIMYGIDTYIAGLSHQIVEGIATLSLYMLYIGIKEIVLIILTLVITLRILRGKSENTSAKTLKLLRQRFYSVLLLLLSLPAGFGVYFLFFMANYGCAYGGRSTIFGPFMSCSELTNWFIAGLGIVVVTLFFVGLIRTILATSALWMSKSR